MSPQGQTRVDGHHESEPSNDPAVRAVGSGRPLSRRQAVQIISQTACIADMRVGGCCWWKDGVCGKYVGWDD